MFDISFVYGGGCLKSILLFKSFSDMSNVLFNGVDGIFIFPNLCLFFVFLNVINPILCYEIGLNTPLYNAYHIEVVL